MSDGVDSMFENYGKDMNILLFPCDTPQQRFKFSRFFALPKEDIILVAKLSVAFELKKGRLCSAKRSEEGGSSAQ